MSSVISRPSVVKGSPTKTSTTWPRWIDAPPLRGARAVDGDGQDGQAGGLGHDEAALLELADPAGAGPRALGRDPDVRPALQQALGVAQAGDGLPPVAAIDLHEAGAPHGRAEDGDLEQLGLGDHAQAALHHAEEHGDVEVALVVRHHHVRPAVVDARAAHAQVELRALDDPPRPGLEARVAGGEIEAAEGGVDHGGRRDAQRLTDGVQRIEDRHAPHHTSIARPAARATRRGKRRAPGERTIRRLTLGGGPGKNRRATRLRATTMGSRG
jgi:hypothetical protein